MKKFVSICLICICILCNRVEAKSVMAPQKSFKEGIYLISDLNIAPNTNYYVENISPTTGVRVFVFDEEYTTMQILKLDPSSLKTDTVLVKDNYTIVIVGGGEIVIHQK